MKLKIGVILFCIYSIAVFVEYASCSSEKNISSLSVYGNKYFSTREVRSMISIPSNELISNKVISEKSNELINAYRQNGFYEAQVEMVVKQGRVDRSTYDIKLHIKEGEQFKVGNVVIHGNKYIDIQPLRRVLTIKEGGTWHPERIEEGINKVLIYYGERGFPFANIETGYFTLDNNKLNVDIRIDEKYPALISRIKVQGNQRTKTKVILRELGFSEGNIYNYTKLKRAQKRLEKLGIFSQVSPIEILSDSSGSRIVHVVKVEEGTTNDINGVLGYIPETIDQKGYFTGIITILLKNAFGSGRLLNVTWERFDRNSQNVNFLFEEPWLFTLPLAGGIEYQLLHRQRDDLQFNFVKSFIKLYGKMPLGEFTISTISVKREVVTPQTDRFREAQHIYSTRMELLYDKRDEIFNPFRGVVYGTSFDYSYKKGKHDTQKYFLKLENYVPLANRLSFSTRVNGRMLNTPTDSLLYTEYFELGGTRSLRGYREGQFYGSTVGWINAELNYFFDRKSSLFNFFDIGYFSRADINSSANQVTIQKTKYGYGFGMRAETRIGFLNIMYGLAEGSSLSDGKIHIAWKQKF